MQNFSFGSGEEMITGRTGLDFHSHVLLSLFLIPKSDSVKKASMAAILQQEIKGKMKPTYICKSVLRQLLESRDLTQKPMRHEGNKGKVS